MSYVLMAVTIVAAIALAVAAASHITAEVRQRLGSEKDTLRRIAIVCVGVAAFCAALFIACAASAIIFDILGTVRVM